MSKVAGRFEMPVGDFAPDGTILKGDEVTPWGKVRGVMIPLWLCCEMPNSFILGVFGARGAGKSTLINTVIGAQILPCDALETSTATAVEITRTARENYCVNVEFLDKSKLQEIMSLAHERLKECLGDLSSLDEDENIKKCIDIIEAHDGKQPNFDELTTHLDDLSRIPEPNRYIPKKFKEPLSKGSVGHSSKDASGIKTLLDKYASASYEFWPIVFRIRVDGPFKGMIEPGMTIVDIPGYGDNHTTFSYRMDKAIRSCNQRLLVLKSEMTGTPQTKAVLRTYCEATERFSVLVAKASQMKKLRLQVDSREEFDKKISEAKKEIVDSLQKLGVIDDLKSLRIFFSELDPQANEEFFPPILEEAISSIMRPTQIEVAKRHLILKTNLARAQGYIRALANGTSENHGFTSTQIQNVAEAILSKHFKEVKTRAQNHFNLPSKCAFPKEVYKGFQFKSLNALFNKSLKIPLARQFIDDLESVVCCRRNQDFHLTVFKFKELWEQLRKDLKAVCGETTFFDNIDTILTTEEELTSTITMEFGAKEVKEALRTAFFEWSQRNHEKGTGSRDRLLTKLFEWVDANAKTLVPVAKDAFLKHLQERMHQMRQNILASLHGTVARVEKCDHGGMPYQTSDCPCRQMAALGGIFSEFDRTIQIRDSHSVTAPEYSWRNAHTLDPRLAESTLNLNNSIPRDLKKFPGKICIISHPQRPGLFRLELDAKPGPKRAIRQVIEVTTTKCAVEEIVKQVLRNMKDSREKQFYAIPFEILEKLVKIVAESVDAELSDCLMK